VKKRDKNRRFQGIKHNITWIKTRPALAHPAHHTPPNRASPGVAEAQGLAVPSR